MPEEAATVEGLAGGSTQRSDQPPRGVGEPLLCLAKDSALLVPASGDGLHQPPRREFDGSSSVKGILDEFRCQQG